MSTLTVAIRFRTATLRLTAVAAMAALCACQGSQQQMAATPKLPQGPQSALVSVIIPVNVAPSSTAEAGVRVPSDYSANTQSLKIWVYQAGVGQVATATLSPLTRSSTNCSTTAAGTVCNIPLSLADGTYYCTVETFAQTGGHGQVLSIQEYIPLTVSGSGTMTTPPWTLWGVPRTMTAAPILTPTSRLVGSNHVALYGGTIQYTITAYDPTGAQIVGAGIPTWSVASSNKSFTIGQPTAQAPNVFSVTAAVTAPITTRLAVTASFPQSAINFCGVVGAICTGLVATVDSIDMAADDWVTFAHDYQRTGYQKQATGLSITTAPKLALRWKLQVPNKAGINANPAVYDGNVIVVTSDPVAVYDFSAIDGSLIWSQTSIAGGSAKPATIDPAAGLVFVGNRQTSPTPSTLYALSLTDGHIVWQTNVLGPTRAAEVVANGKIYLGSAGGDPPPCLNKGVQRLDEATGNIDWTWYVNTLTNPGGGGAVWGAIAYDGSHLIFPTGNVCQVSGTGAGAVTTADGAASLDLNGNLLWSFVAWAQLGSNAIDLDYDTGSSVMVQNAGTSSETATFLNKNGLLYTFNTSGLSSATPGATLAREPAANQYYGYGFYASPTSDGNMTVVGTGTYGDSWTGVTSTGRSAQTVRAGLRPDYFTPQGTRRPNRAVAGYYCLIRGFNPDGSRRWSYQTTDIISGYIALANGVAISASDSSVVALNVNGSGVLTPLWSYATAGTVDNSAAIVPSGIYVADNDGYVYAFTPPLSGP